MNVLDSLMWRQKQLMIYNSRCGSREGTGRSGSFQCHVYTMTHDYSMRFFFLRNQSIGLWQKNKRITSILIHFTIKAVSPRMFVFWPPAKRHIGITVSVICLSIRHALLLLAPHIFRGTLVLFNLYARIKYIFTSSKIHCNAKAIYYACISIESFTHFHLLAFTSWLTHVMNRRISSW